VAAEIVVVGGGVCGLAAGILLARDGHEVSVLERDAEPVLRAWIRSSVCRLRSATVAGIPAMSACTPLRRDARPWSTSSARSLRASRG
jgi:2-polyprenyl-6-methoxyphenol hydroxylase-like FAD-dependent oxidoreductase